MVRRKIKWTFNALNDKLSIFEFWYRKNGNAKYSRQLDKEFRHLTDLLKQYVNLGKKYPDSKRRYLVKESFQIFYKIQDDYIEILHIWDTRQNPENMPL